MLPEVALRDVASAAYHFANLLSASSRERDSRPDGRAVGARPLKFHGEPVVRVRGGVLEQRGGLAEIGNEDFQFAVIVEIAESAAAAGMGLEHGGSGALGNLLEAPVAEVSKDLARHLEAVIGNNFFDFGIDCPVYLAQVEPAVIIEVGEAGAPADVARLDGQSRSRGDVVEKLAFDVAIEDGRVVAEVGGEDIEPAVAVEVADRHAHVRL